MLETHQNTMLIKQHALLTSVEKLNGISVAIIGDVMLDEYIFGSVERISPEAPVPIVRIEKEEYRLGGAGNVAKNIAALGGDPKLFGFMGQDHGGQRLKEILRENGIEDRCIQECDRPTTRKTRVIAQQQQIVRIDRESTCIPSSDGLLTVLDGVEKAMEMCAVLIVSDYGKGLISTHVMSELRRICVSKLHKPLIIVDPKPKNYSAYSGVSMLTPNAKEAGIEFVSLEGDPNQREDAWTEAVIAAGKKLMHDLQCNQLLITLGARGMMLFTSPSRAVHIPTAAKKVYDVTGAGDTVIAVLGLALAAGIDSLQACFLANYAAGLVVGQIGATAVQPEQLKEAIMSWSLLGAKEFSVQ